MISQRNHVSVHFGADAAMTNVGMDPVCEIERCRSFGQLDHLAFGCVYVDGCYADVAAQTVEQFVRGVGVFKPVVHLIEPTQLRLRIRIILFFVVFIFPVRGDPLAGCPVHFFGSNLDFERASAFEHHGGVNGLVHIEFGRGDVVFESTALRRPGMVYHSERVVAAADGLGDDPDGEHIEDFVVGFALCVHLSINSVQVLRATNDVRAYFSFLKRFFNERDFPLEQGFTLAAFHCHELGDFFVFLRVEMVEGVIFHFPLPVRQSESIGHWHVDVERFLADAFDFILWQVFNGAHIVQSIRYLDQDNPDIFCGGDEHFSKILGLFLFACGGNVRQMQGSDLGNAVNQGGDIFPEFFDELFVGHGGVFEDIVQEAG